MTTTMKKLLMFGCMALLIVLSYTQVKAQSQSGTAPSTTTGTQSGTAPATKTDTNGALNIHLNNPLNGVSTIPEAINLILSIVIRIALPLIIIAFIYAGFKFITARGNPKELETAKNMFLYTVIGTMLILGAWTITNAIVGTVNTIVK